MMDSGVEMRQSDVQVLRVNPKKFTLWLFIVSIVMIFISMTSAYIVKRAEGDWLMFELPSALTYTTFVILASSISMHWAYISAKRDNITNIKNGLIVTLLLSLVFLYGQLIGWSQLVESDVYFVGNAAGSFVYVLTGLHAFHLISGIIFIIITLISAFKFKVHSKRLVQIENCTTYWHFLGGLWVYLYLFLTLYN